MRKILSPPARDNRPNRPGLRYRVGLHRTVFLGAGLSCVFLLGTRLRAEDLTFFESNIRPLLTERCLGCHGEKKQEGGLRLDSRAGWQQGGDSGTALVPGKPEESLLIKAVSYLENDLQMPPKQQLALHEVTLLKEWVRLGAPDPRLTAPPAAAKQPAGDEWAEAFKKRLEWWSLQPLATPQPPTITDAAWSEEPIDRFVRAALNGAGLPPTAPAEPEVLLRRLAFVLTGLPPTPAQRDGFLEHWQRDADAAYAKLVDELLASSHFGERFARHWMDVARYTDTYGYEWDNPAKGSWEYRDYLIRAFNQDVGYRQFVTEQIAGDLLPQPRIDRELGVNESIIGPMFYHMGEHRHGASLAFNGTHQDMVNNKIDAFSKAFLAISVACAHCHDHKLEAVSQRDYYALGAVFMTPRWTSRVADAPGKNDVAIDKLKALRGQIRHELAQQWLAAANREGAWSQDVLQQTIDAKEAAGLKPDDVAYPLARMITSQNTKTPIEIEKLWSELAKQWRDAREQRTQANADFKVLADFQEPTLPAGWVSDGDGMKHGFVTDGAPLVALDGEAVVARLLPRGYHTHALSSKLPGALRMPAEHTVPGQFASVSIAGGEFGGYLTVPANAFQNEGVTFLNSVAPVWKSFADETLKNGVTRVTVEFATAALNPNFPPRWRVAGKLDDTDFGYDKRSWLSITGIVSHEKAGKPQDLLDQFAPLYEAQPGSEGAGQHGDAPHSYDEAWQRVGDWLAATVRRWSDGTPRTGDVHVINWLLSKKLLPNRAEDGSPLAKLLAEYRQAEQAISFPRTVNSMDERELVKSSYPLDVRGNVDAPGELVPPDFLQMFAGRNDVAKSPGSGRLELAESLLQTEHPLTSRVYVNRVWQWIFGTGLVATPNDFGRLGDKPSHPELLDYVAREFMRQQWSTKTLVRRLVLSQTFRQGGTMTNAARQRDPENRLLHHYATRRLEAEAIRDSLLAVSGRLDPKLYGRPVDPPRTAQDALKRLFAGPLDGQGRRSIYLRMSIMEPPKFLVGFNLPDLRLPTGKRDVTNVPTQALIMLNDPLVAEMAKVWAAGLIKTEHGTAEDRVRAMFVQALGRNPQAAELQRWTAGLRDLATPGGSALMEDEAAWSQLAHALFNTKEFIYYR